MLDYPPAIRRLIDALRRLPSIGPRGAERLALFLMQQDASLADELAAAIGHARRAVRPCPITGFFTEGAHSPMLDDPRRDRALLCVVEHASDVLALERSNAFRGIYFVLGGCLSPLDDIGPEDLRIPQLLDWVRREGISEVILGLNPDVKGETTALYLAAELKKLDVRVTRPATGLSAGSALDYADPVTLTHALEGRKVL